jgi:ribosomal protein S18 acetylase RimI-like enzyme
LWKVQGLDIVSILPEHVDQLHAIYLAQVARAPHCRFAPDQARFRDELLGLASRPASLFPAPRQAQVFVAAASDTVHGFAALTEYQEWDGIEYQAITGLFFAHEAAGHALVRACEAHATKAELRAFPATHGNTLPRTYNAGWDGLSDHIPGVARMLTRHGYTPYFRELHLSQQLPLAQHEPWSLPLPIILRQAPGDHGTLRLQALDGDNEVGICYYSTLTFLTDEPAASQTGYIWWLHVNEAYRRRGVARALMAATIDDLVTQGCRACWLTTTADNWAAQALYLALGFDVVDCSVSFRKLRRSAE